MFIPGCDDVFMWCCSILATCSADKSAKIWNTTDFSILFTLSEDFPSAPPSFHNWFWDCAFTRDSSHLLTGTTYTPYTCYICKFLQSFHQSLEPFFNFHYFCDNMNNIEWIYLLSLEIRDRNLTIFDRNSSYTSFHSFLIVCWGETTKPFFSRNTYSHML